MDRESSIGRFGRAYGRVTLVGAVVALALATHYEVLSYWFTGPDTLTLIETSRIRGTESAIDTLTAPLMHGTNFVTLTGTFYRPVASLSYAVEYWVWGLDPVGYHLTDLLLHATAAALVVALVLKGFDGLERFEGERTGTGGWDAVSKSGLLAAGLAGGLFALHPLTAEVVPVPARRHDVLATVFVLASLVALARGLRASWPEPRLKYLAVSLVAYALALGSKEVSVILPTLAVTWTALDTYGRSGRVVRTIRETVLVGVGYAVVSLCYLGLRVSLLGGIGGYVGPFGGVKDAPAALIATQYLLSLFYPVDLLGLNGSVAYVPGTIYVALALGAGLFGLGVVGAGGLRPFFRGATGRLAVFFAVWLLCPLPLIVRVGEYSPWTGYIALVPVAGLTALIVTSGARGVVQGVSRLTETRGAEGDSSGVEAIRAGLGGGMSLGVFVLAFCLVGSLVWVSPLAQPYDGWEHAGEVTEEALTESERELDDLPPEAVVKVEGLPNVVTLGPPTAEPRVKSLRYFWAHSVRSWVRLREPKSRISTFTHGVTTPVGNGSVDVRVVVNPRPNGPTVMRFRYESRAASNRVDRWEWENARDDARRERRVFDERAGRRKG